jgi:hypothetical protein
LSTPSRTKQRRQSQGQSRAPQRRPIATSTRQPARPPAPVDYSQDFADVRHDLIRISIWAGLLFAAMIGGSFFV